MRFEITLNINGRIVKVGELKDGSVGISTGFITFNIDIVNAKLLRAWLNQYLNRHLRE